MAISGGDGSIILTTQIDQTGLKRGMASMKSGVAGLSKSFAKIGAAIGVAFGVGALINFGKQAVQLASDLQEVQNVVDVAFGDMSYKAEEFAKTAIESFGISELSAKRTASTYMAMAKGMGIASDVGSDMAIQLTALSADMASFYNVSQEMADTALKSIFTGETETLKQYGIVMTEVNLEQYALSQGITKSVSAMTQQEKTMLRYQFVLEQTALAQGDFVRTQDSWANQTRVLSERWKEMQAQFGEAFIAIGTLVLPIINSIINGLIKIAKVATLVAQSIYKAFTGRELSVKSSNEEAEAISLAVQNQNDLTEAVEDTNKALKGTTASYDEVNTLSRQSVKGNTSPGISTPTSSNGPTSQDINEIETEFEGLESVFDKISQKLGQIWKSAPVQVFVEFVKAAFNALREFLSKIAEKIKEKFAETWEKIKDSLLEAIGNLVGLWENFWKDLKEAIEKWTQPIINAINELIDEIWDSFIGRFLQIISDIFNDFIKIIKELWDKYGKELLNNIGEFINTTIGLFKSLYENIIKPIIEPLLETLSWLWDKHLSGLVKKVGEFVMKLANGALEIYNNFIAPVVSWLSDIFSPIWSIVSSSVIGVFGSLIAYLSDMVGNIIDMFSGIIDFLTGVFTGNWKKAWTGIKNIFKSIVSGFANIFKLPINLIIDGINAFISGLNKIKIPNWVPMVGGKGFDVPKIPKLAQGAVIPPNREFLAVLGDQKHGTNIETPESLLREIYAEGNAETNALLQQLIQVMQKGMTVNVDGKQLMRINREAETRVGRQTVTGGFANAY